MKAIETVPQSGLVGLPVLCNVTSAQVISIISYEISRSHHGFTVLLFGTLILHVLQVLTEKI